MTGAKPVAGMVAAAAILGALLLVGRDRAEPTAAAEPAGETTAAPTDHPDVILIVIDTCRRDAFGCYGDPRDNTPELDRFAADNVRFDRAIACAPWTLPSIASMLTSKMPTVHGAYRQGDRHSGLRAAVKTGAQLLRERGYHTCAVANAAFVSPAFGIDRGFDVYDFRPAESADLRRAGESVDLALEMLEEGRDRPDFLFLHLFDPHMPYDPPGRFRKLWTADYQGDWKLPLQLHKQTMQADWMPSPEDLRYMHLTYEAEIAYVSEQLGRFFDTLRERGMWDDTLILLTADHGEEFHEHGGWQHGHSYYDEVVHVPLLMKVPARTEVARQVVGAQVSLLDLMPTVFDVIGGGIPEDFSGVSLMPAVTGAKEPADEIAVSERNRREGEQISLRDDRWTFIWDLEKETARLYDWREDPQEQDDLATARPDDVARLRAELQTVQDRMEADAAAAGGRDLVTPDERLQEQLESLGYVGD